MSNTYFTLADLVKVNDLNARDLGVSDILNRAPFLRQLHATTASNGTLHHYIKQTTAPTVGFRALSVGKANSSSGYTEVDITLKLLDASWFVDCALADNYKGGADGFLARESINAIQQAFFVFEKQIFYGTGTGGDSGGFAGLSNNTAYDGLSDALVVNAAGSTATTGSSIWLVRSTPDEKGMTAVIGNSGNIAIGQPVVTLKADDSDATASFGAYYTKIQAYGGLQIGSAYSAVRIANITAQSTKTATDALISQGLALFPADQPATHIVMNRRSLQQLQASRTATSPSGAPAPFPQDSYGVPIIVTDAILSTEAILT